MTPGAGKQECCDIAGTGYLRDKNLDISGQECSRKLQRFRTLRRLIHTSK